MKPSRFRQHRPGAKSPQRGARRAPPAEASSNAVTWAGMAGGPLPQPFAVTEPWSGDESTWLPLARKAWQIGDWPTLAALADRPLQRHPDRARLALLAAAGHFQQGNAAAVRRLVELALAWGCDKHLVSRVLISGLHNTLGRAASVLDQPARALTQFAAAILTASPGSQVRTATQSRASEQLAQLGLSVTAPEVPDGTPVADP